MNFDDFRAFSVKGERGNLSKGFVEVKGLGREPLEGVEDCIKAVVELINSSRVLPVVEEAVGGAGGALEEDCLRFIAFGGSGSGGRGGREEEERGGGRGEGRRRGRKEDWFRWVIGNFL
jgi:hypothetical protein